MSDDTTEIETDAEVPDPEEPEFEDEDADDDGGDSEDDGEGAAADGDDPDDGGGEAEETAPAEPEAVEVDVPTLGRMKLPKAEADALAVPGVAKVIADLAEQVKNHQRRADQAAKAAPAPAAQQAAPEPGLNDYIRADHEWTDYRARLNAALAQAIDDGDDDAARQIRARDSEAVAKIDGFRRAVAAIQSRQAQTAERADLLDAARALPEIRELLTATRPLREANEILKPILAKCDPAAGVSEEDARSTYNAILVQCGIEPDSQAEKSNRQTLIGMAARDAELAALRRIVKNGGAKNGGAKPHGRPAPVPSSGSIPRRGSEPSAALPSGRGARITKDDLIRASMKRFTGR